MKVREVQEKLLGAKKKYFWDINNQFKKKCSSGAQISGGGVRLIWAMPRFKQFFFMCVLPKLVRGKS